MKTGTRVAIIAAVLGLTGRSVHAAFPGTPVTKCAADAARVGTVCMDKYEASVWQINPTNLAGKSNANLIKKVQKGTATAADLAAGNATQRGVAADNYPGSCPNSGQGCADLYAVSLPAVIPSAFITWFQAQQACANSLKRLPGNVEWQMAVSGTPDPGADNGTTNCNTASAAVAVATGSRNGCVSRWGHFDMVGNLDEWVADWVPASTTCPGWGAFSTDFMCLSGASTTDPGPGALLRGGFFMSGTTAGPMAVDGGLPPQFGVNAVGFRCAR